MNITLFQYNVVRSRGRTRTRTIILAVFVCCDDSANPEPFPHRPGGILLSARCVTRTSIRQGQHRLAQTHTCIKFSEKLFLRFTSPFESLERRGPAGRDD